MQQPAIQVRNLRKSFRKRNGFRKVRALGGRRRLVQRRAGRDVRAAGAERLRQVEFDSHPFDSADRRQRRGASARLHACRSSRMKCAGSSGASASTRPFYKKLSARENLLYTALLYGQNAREARPRDGDSRTAGNGEREVLDAARGDESRYAAEDQHRARADDQSAAAAARRADDGSRSEEPSRRAVVS